MMERRCHGCSNFFDDLKCVFVQVMFFWGDQYVTSIGVNRHRYKPLRPLMLGVLCTSIDTKISPKIILLHHHHHHNNNSRITNRIIHRITKRTTKRINNKSNNTTNIWSNNRTNIYIKYLWKYIQQMLDKLFLIYHN